MKNYLTQAAVSDALREYYADLYRQIERDIRRTSSATRDPADLARELREIRELLAEQLADCLPICFRGGRADGQSLH